MKRRSALFTPLAAALTLLASFGPSLHAADGPALTAADLASRMNAIRVDGTSFVRLRMEINGGGSIQIQAKQRMTQGGSDVVYQILFPKERKGESVLLRKPSSGAATGTVYLPPDTLKPLTAAEMKNGLFGSDLTHEDVMENFFAWSQQTLVGTEDIGRISCQILESKPSVSDRSSYASVRTWIDPRRMVPMRVEKNNASGSVLVRIETLSVAKDDLGREVPSSVHIARAGITGKGTTLDGSRIKHGVTLTDADFTPDALKSLSAPK
ncbi:outer membrane lipoprotein-sorting protein [Prosthecobacter sp. SYSU 5D2]|uniref:outer membrane lipoprotein-sorting protein n=1 Tax=Prosthecobacter sp. SYSU 5D2 TaxID=3134134 RepID=UPI0031FEBE54